MRHLLQPRVLSLAVATALVSALVSYPRMVLWTTRTDAIWLLEVMLFLCGAVLWGFVFAWHTPYTNQPAFIFKLDAGPVILATLTAIVAAMIYHLGVDPSLRAQLPEDYPKDLQHWFASLPFLFTFNALFSIFAPFDMAMRLTKNQRVAMIFTGIWSASIVAMKVHSLAIPISPFMFAGLLGMRFLMASLAVAFYLRGGVFLVWWWMFLFETRHWLDLPQGH